MHLMFENTLYNWQLSNRLYMMLRWTEHNLNYIWYMLIHLSHMWHIDSFYWNRMDMNHWINNSHFDMQNTFRLLDHMLNISYLYTMHMSILMDNILMHMLYMLRQMNIPYNWLFYSNIMYMFHLINNIHSYRRYMSSLFGNTLYILLWSNMLYMRLHLDRNLRHI